MHSSFVFSFRARRIAARRIAPLETLSELPECYIMVNNYYFVDGALVPREFILPASSLSYCHLYEADYGEA